MASGAKSFLLNRKSDWQYNSIINNLELKNDMLISQNKNGENGVYIAGPFDSMEFETVWHRLRINVDLPSGAVYKLRIYASDRPEVLVPSKESRGLGRINLNEYLSNDKIDVHRKVDLFDDIGAKCYKNPNDVILYDFKGKYLWICLEFINYDQKPIKVSSIKIEFPKVSFIDYLPEIYKEEENNSKFLERFIGIFQSIYVDLEDKIDYTAIKYDVDRTTKDFLSWIGDWLSIKNASIWSEEKLRKLIKEAIKIYKMKGTKRAVAKMVKEYLGIEPIIVEQFDVKENMYYHKQKEVVEKLFGDNGYVFTVMVPQAYIKDTESYVELLRVINEVKPVDSICNLVVLSDQIYLDNHCYVGINSFITNTEDFVIDKSQDINNLVVSS